MSHSSFGPHRPFLTTIVPVSVNEAEGAAYERKKRERSAISADLVPSDSNLIWEEAIEFANGQSAHGCRIREGSAERSLSPIETYVADPHWY